MKRTVQLSDAETQKVREFIKLHGLPDAAKGLGVHTATLTKAAAGARVHVLTASVIRGRLQVL